VCYSIYLSTSSQEDLSLLASDQFTFIPIADPVEPEESWKRWAADPLFISDTAEASDDPEILALLDHPQKWYLESKYGGCSCHFRHWGFIWKNLSDATFSVPVDWSPEDEVEIESTKAVYDALVDVVKNGYCVDLVDCWSGSEAKDIQTLEVSLTNIPRDQFRFFGGVKFTLSS
jgi:hypothetical protein